MEARPSSHAQSPLAHARHWGRRAAPAAGTLVALLASVLVLSQSAAADGEVLVERPTPFELPQTYAEPNAFVADAAPGSNGTAHYLVATRFSWYYIWANTTTGESLEVLNLTELGMSAQDFLQTYSDLTWRMSLLDVQGGRVLIARGSANAVVDIVFFAEGDSAHAIGNKLLLPPPAYGNTTSLYALAIARNASDPLQPSVVWARNVPAYGANQVATEFGEIPVDLARLAVGRARVLAVQGNWSIFSYSWSGGTGPIYDSYRLMANSQPLAGAIGTATGLWLTMVGTQYTCTYYYQNQCYSYTYNWTWNSFSPTHGFRELERTQLGNQPNPYFLQTRTTAAAAPDGSVAVGMTRSDGWGQARIGWARLQDSPSSISTARLAVSIVTGAEMYVDSLGVGFVVVTLQNGTVWPESRVFLAAGWPATINATLVGRVERPLERVRVTSVSPSALVLVGGTQNQWAKTQESAAGSQMPNTSYAQAWPAVVRVASGSASVRGVTNWQQLVPASVTSIALATLDDGSRVGAVVSLENGTGTVRLLTASGSPLRFVLGPPILDLHMEAVSVQAVAMGDRALIVVHVVRPFMWNYVSGYFYEGHLWFTANSDGAMSSLRPAYPETPPTYSYVYGNSWALSASSGRGLLQTAGGLFILNPTTGRSQLRISTAPDLSGIPANLSKFIGNNETFAPPSGFNDYTYCSYYSYVFCFHSIAWWLEGDELYGAYIVSNYSLTYSYYYCNCVFKVRVVHWSAGDTVEWAERALVTGAANDTLYFPPYADLAITSNGETTTLVVSARQPNLWERVFRVNYTRSTNTFSAPQLLREVTAPPYTYLRDHLGRSADFAAVVKTAESGTAYSYPYPIPMRDAFAVNSTSTRTLRFEGVTLNCYWNYWYYYPWDWPYYYNQFGCPRWIPTSWGDEVAFLVVEFGRARFFSVNHPPTAPRLISPEDGALLADRAVGFRVSPAVDIDQDRLVYRFELFDRFGNLLQRIERDRPDLDLELGDGRYSWTCSVTDGVLRVACIGNFSFTLDATPPQAYAGLYEVLPGEGVRLDGSGSSDDTGIVSYTWRIGEVDDSNRLTREGVAPELSWAELSPFFGVLTATSIQLTVVDGSGLSAGDNGIIFLLDVPLELELVLRTPSPTEGELVEVAANITWGRLRFAWDDAAASFTGLTLLWKFPFNSGAEGARASFFAQDSGAFVVLATAIHSRGGIGSGEMSLTIANVAPEADGEGPTQLDEGEPGTLRVSASDASPVDAQSLSIEWMVEGGVELQGTGFNVTLLARTNGIATVRATVSDKDGARTTVEFPLTIAEAADPASGLWVAAVGIRWVELRWMPTPETDFVSYEVTVRDAEGEVVRVEPLTGLSRMATREVIEGLEPETFYTFDLQVVATGGVRSTPVSASATTAPPEAEEQPPTPTPPGSEGPAPIPPASNPGTPTQISTEAAGVEGLWMVIAILAGAAVMLYLTRIRQTRRE